ncbi:MAG: hypothetical protein AAFO58_06145, partial [Pseudomonadota bacterium]
AFGAAMLACWIGAAAEARCVTPVYPPLDFVRPAWSELEALKTSPPAGSGIIKRQDIAANGQGALNLDFYSISIDANGQNAATLLAEIRANLNGLMFDGTSYSVAPFDAANAAIWQSGAPSNAVMVFTLAEIPGVMPLERGGVFVACASATDFVFSTLDMDDYGVHPVAGSRAFGVHDHGDGTLGIYVMAADRVVNEGRYAVLPGPAHELVFSQGDAVWQRMLNNIETQYKDRNPGGRFVFSTRVPF